MHSFAIRCIISTYALLVSILSIRLPSKNIALSRVVLQGQPRLTFREGETFAAIIISICSSVLDQHVQLLKSTKFKTSLSFYYIIATPIKTIKLSVKQSTSVSTN